MTTENIGTNFEEARSIDLHAHTTASDGQHAPRELVEMAAAAGLTALAITDHDTTAGIAEAQKAGDEIGIMIVPGIELSAEPPKTDSGARSQCHILGLFIDPNSPGLLQRLEDVIRNRNRRNARIIDRMRNELNWDITLSEVIEAAGGEVIARPHFGRVMLEKGYVRSMKEAFDVYLGKGGLAYVERDRLSDEEAIALIHQAGGVAILAHPNNLRMKPDECEAYIDGLRNMGLDGIEARYNLHTPDDTARYLALAARLGMLTSGGSDFHGLGVKATVYLGHVEDGRPAPDRLLTELRDRRRS